MLSDAAIAPHRDQQSQTPPRPLADRPQEQPHDERQREGQRRSLRERGETEGDASQHYELPPGTDRRVHDQERVEHERGDPKAVT